MSAVQQKHIARLDDIEKRLPSTSAKWQAIWKERRAESVAKDQANVQSYAEAQIQKLKEIGLAVGDEVSMQAASMLPNVPGQLHQGTVKQAKRGNVYVHTNHGNFDVFRNPWRKVAAETPAPAGVSVSGEGKRPLQITYEGRTISVTPPKRRGYSNIVLVDAAKFDAAWAEDKGFYVGPGGTGAAIEGRYQNFKEWIATHDSITASCVDVDAQGRVRVGDGRHRLAVLRDAGLKTLPVAMSKASVKNAEKAGMLGGEAAEIVAQPRVATGVVAHKSAEAEKQAPEAPASEVRPVTYEIGDEVRPIRSRKILRAGRIQHIKTNGDGSQRLKVVGQPAGLYFNASDYELRAEGRGDWIPHTPTLSRQGRGSRRRRDGETGSASDRTDGYGRHACDRACSRFVRPHPQ